MTKGKGKSKGKAKNKARETFAEKSTSTEQKGTEKELPIDDPANGLTSKDATIDEGTTKTNGHHVKTTVESENESEEKAGLPLQNGGKGKSKDKEADLPPAYSKDEDEECGRDGPPFDEAAARQSYADIMDPKTGVFDQISTAIMNTGACQLTDASNHSGFSGSKLRVFKKTYNIMEKYIRPQTASPDRLKFICRLLAIPEFIKALSPVIDELRWNCAVVEHPNNPMITTVLQETAHVRPTDGIHDPSDISVAPLLRIKYPLLPEGPAETTPAIITKLFPKRPTRKRSGVASLIKLKYSGIKDRASLEEELKGLDQRQGILMAEIRAELSRPLAEIWDDVQANDDRRAFLKEKARLEDAGGKIADRLARRLKKRTEDQGAGMILIP